MTFIYESFCTVSVHTPRLLFPVLLSLTCPNSTDSTEAYEEKRRKTQMTVSVTISCNLFHPSARTARLIFSETISREATARPCPNATETETMPNYMEEDDRDLSWQKPGTFHFPIPLSAFRFADVTMRRRQTRLTVLCSLSNDDMIRLGHEGTQAKVHWKGGCHEDRGEPCVSHHVVASPRPREAFREASGTS
jgi:hypothetical protein